MKKAPVLLLLLALLSSCAKAPANDEPAPEVKEPSALEKTMDAMTTEEKVYQLFFVSASSVEEEELPVG